MDCYNVLVAGVGGQGSLVLGNVIAEAASKKGFSPVIGQIFGASRRGGTVFTHIRLARGQVGPLIPRGQVDLLVGLEPMEALRAAAELAGERTTTIMNTAKIETLGTLAGLVTYPDIEEIISSVKRVCGVVITVDARETLELLGSPVVLNSFMLGTMTGVEGFPLSREEVRKGLQETLVSDLPNLKAFDAGVVALEDRDE
jgi:indolepyruvate ferredoxin oxidoreductase beta subunit